MVKVIVIIMANHDELISFVKIMKCFDRFAIYSYKAPAKTVLKFLYNGYGSLDDLITGNIKCEFVIFGQLASKRVLINQQVGAAFGNFLIYEGTFIEEIFKFFVLGTRKA